MKSSIRRIFVPLDPSIYATAAAETACRFARIHSEAQVAGVAVLDSVEIRSSVIPAFGPYYPMMNDVVKEKVDHADKILSDCLKQFKTLCDRADIDHIETEYEGIPVQKLLESAIFFDLMVVGLETSFHFETRAESAKGDSLADLLDRTITPVVAVPAVGMDKLESALITIDGSLGSARAMHDFVKFAEPYDISATVLVAEKETKQTDFLLKSSTEFLQSHGIEKVDVDQSSSPIEGVVGDDYLKEFDIVVAGIHSRNSIKDYFVGSFVKALIAKKSKPLFLSH